jgi:hypothetical protein
MNLVESAHYTSLFILTENLLINEGVINEEDIKTEQVSYSLSSL